MLLIPAVFLGLLIAGIFMQELSARRAAVFLVIAIAALVTTYLLDLHVTVFAVVLCILDIILILMIFKGDIRLR